MTLADRLPANSNPDGPDPDVLVEVFAEWAFEEQGISLYPAQEEALLEMEIGLETSKVQHERPIRG